MHAIGTGCGPGLLTAMYRHGYTVRVSPKTATALRIDEDLLEAMRQVKDEKGIPITVQFELAARAWLEREHDL